MRVEETENFHRFRDECFTVTITRTTLQKRNRTRYDKGRRSSGLEEGGAKV